MQEDYTLAELTISPGSRIRIILDTSFIVQEFNLGDNDWSTVSKSATYQGAMAKFLSRLLDKMADGIFG